MTHPFPSAGAGRAGRCVLRGADVDGGVAHRAGGAVLPLGQIHGGDAAARHSWVPVHTNRALR